MLETRSAIYKMMEATRDERKINKWPPPFSSEITPNNEKNFDAIVRCSCKTSNLSPRIAKTIIIGDVSVGKSCLVNRFCHKVFDNNYKATIGVDFEVERFEILGVPFHLQIWDTAGQERFKSIAASYYRGSNAIIVVFDLTNLISLGNCEQWLLEASKSNPNQFQVFLVATKRDLLSDRVYEIIEKRATRVAQKMNAEFWAVSSRTGDRVSELFARVAALTFQTTILHELENKSPQSISIGLDLITLNDRTRRVEKKKIKNKCFNCEH